MIFLRVAQQGSAGFWRSKKFVPGEKVDQRKKNLTASVGLKVGGSFLSHHSRVIGGKHLENFQPDQKIVGSHPGLTHKL